MKWKDQEMEDMVLESMITKLNEIAIVHKAHIENSQITKVNLKQDTNDEKIEKLLGVLSYNTDFDLLNSPILLFPDKSLMDQLTILGLTSRSQRWFINIDDILKQFDRLEKNENIFIDKPLTLLAILDHLNIKFKSDLLNEFDFFKQYDKKKESNIVHREMSLLIDKLNAQDKKNTTLKLPNHFAKQFIQNMKNAEAALGKENIKEYRKEMRKLSSGDSKAFVSGLKIMYSGENKNEFYTELFDLYKLILKDLRRPLLSYEEYLSNQGLLEVNKHLDKAVQEKDEKQNRAHYRNYKIARTRKIYLGK